MLSSLARRSLASRAAASALPRLRALSTVSPGPVGSHDHHIREFKDLTGEALFRMSVQQGGCLGSSRERLVREVMIVDSISHEDALEVVRDMARKKNGIVTVMFFSPSSKIIGISTNEIGYTYFKAHGRQCTRRGRYARV